ncbi:hypothetical protein PAEPH01_0715 [Pancytospora epiphaga]|nr:hypothetical protein PAEPH01_0715 [Pancytospora epiphaga]
MATLDNKRIISILALVNILLASSHNEDNLDKASSLDEWEDISSNEISIFEDISLEHDSDKISIERTSVSVNSHLIEGSSNSKSAISKPEDVDFVFCSHFDESIKTENLKDDTVEYISIINPVTDEDYAMNTTAKLFDDFQIGERTDEEINFTREFISTFLSKMTGERVTFERNYKEKLEVFKEQLLMWNSMGDYQEIVEILMKYNFYRLELALITKLAKEDKQRLGNLYKAGEFLIANIDKVFNPKMSFLKQKLGCKFVELTPEYLEAKITPDFLKLLDIDDIIAIIESILEPELGLPRKDTNNIMRRIFKFIDNKPDLVITSERASKIIIGILTSKTPECFEQVYLTFKMWDVITHKQQNNLINVIGSGVYEIPRETFIMLYLFISRPTDNIISPKELKEWFIMSYMHQYPSDLLYDSKTLENVLIYPDQMMIELTEIANNFDGSLIYLPEILKKLKDNVLFESNIVEYLTNNLKDAKYATHIIMGLIKHYKLTNQAALKLQ